MKVTSLFLDAPRVLREVESTKRRAMGKSLGWIRKVAQRSIRRRKGYAPAGKPPHSHTDLLKRFIYYAYDPATGGGIVGPVALRNTDGQAPHTLEHGGWALVRKRVHRRGHAFRSRQLIRVHYKPRPFMAPALRKALDRGIIPKSFANWGRTAA